MQQIVECIPNFSDGRRPEVYNAIADAVRGVKGVKVLGVSSDADHNRTVITFVGAPADVEEAAFRAIRTASELINLEEHEGEHPRIGATDVCPFVPVKNVTMADCVAMAQRVGKRVGNELGIAVYLYSEAATRPNRKKLSAIRKGQYELWKDEVATNPNREPDFGPAEPKPWGATVIGARPFLIAYNLFLNTDDVAIAQKIAKSVRHVSGGLRYVQAMGFLVEGQAQVSMNLTNFEKTPIHRMQEMVKREAAQHGLMVTKAELVGLIPQQALTNAAKWYLQLEEMDDELILENRLHDEPEAEGLPIPHELIELTASKSATPGGGSIAALVATLGAALAEMMAALTVGRKKYADVSDEVAGFASEVKVLREKLTASIQEDVDAFDAVMAAYRNKALQGDEKAQVIETAMIHAGEVPLQVARYCLEVSKLAKEIVARGNTNAVTDGASSVLMARSAAQAAGMNVKINGSGLKDTALANLWRAEVDQIDTEMEMLTKEVMAIAAERGGFA